MMFTLCAWLVASVVAVPSTSTSDAERGAESTARAPAAETTTRVELSAADWSGIRTAYESKRHAVVAQGDEFRARNPGQGWVTRFDGRGFTVTPDHGAWTWGLELASFGFEGAQQTVTSPAATCAQGERVEYDWNTRLTEWFVNDTRGLEHGFTVLERPEGGEGELDFTLRVRGELVPAVVDGGRGVRFSNADGADVLTYGGLVVFDADGRALPARFEPIAATAVRLSIDERYARYPLTIDPVAQQAYLKASNTSAHARFGDAVSVSGDTLVVGAPHEGNDDSGAAYVFVRNGTTWSQQAYLKASNAAPGDLFGHQVSVSGDTIVVGAFDEDSNATGVGGNESDDSASNSGAAYVFVRNGATWSQQAYLKASNTETNDRFGYTVSVSGDTVAVGAFDEDSNASGVNGDQFDNSLQFVGAAYVFVRVGTTWSQQAYIKASNPGDFDDFSIVALSGNTLVVGATQESSNATGVGGNQLDNSAPGAGAAYVFVRVGTTWSQQAYLKASNTEAEDHFGHSVSISGDTVVIGAGYEDSDAIGVDGNQSNNNAVQSGAAYVFVRSGTTWSQQAYLKASNTGAGDQFGYLGSSVAGDTIVVGASLESSSAIGIDGNGSDNDATNAGAAYVFKRSGTTWSPYAYLKASNTGASDNLGKSVSVWGDTVVVGAGGEDSNATGVNGNESDDSAANAGAAYVFDLASPLETYCSGDGSLATPCPCVAPNTVPSPPAAPGHGCANSLDLDGALLSASGTLSPDTLKFTVDVAPLYSGFAFLVKGNATNASGIAASDGVRCADGALIRFGSHNAGTNGNPSGQWIYPNTAQTTAISTLTLQPAGQFAYYQLFYRNAAASFCTSATANWSNGIIVPWP